MIQQLSNILQSILHGKLSTVYTLENIVAIQNEAVRLIEFPQWTQDDIMTATLIVQICNVIYNNSTMMSPVEDGIYDQLMVLYQMHDPTNYQIGSPEGIVFDNEGRETIEGEKASWNPITFGNPDEIREGLFTDNFTTDCQFDPRWFDPTQYKIDPSRQIYRTNPHDVKDIPHGYPNLAGTLDKCKFTLVKEAMEAGMDQDPSIRIFERDFLWKHMSQGIFNPNEVITLLLELKYDGMAVEADCSDHIHGARSRGDTNQDLCEDLSPVLEGYPFFNAERMKGAPPIGVQFEAIMTNQNVQRLKKLTGKDYKNARNGVIGLMKSNNAYAYRDLITLVPLRTSLDIDPITEVNFLNTYYTTGVPLKYAVIQGTYNEILFQVHKFVQEAQSIREIMPFMYDGVVVHYVDPRIRQALGRVNSVNKYSIAIKFNPMVKEAIFLGYTYTVGQNGVITPMAHYTAVEFFGTIHTKSSAHSYQRFKDLNLSVGDVVSLAYVNDVMPYLSKAYDTPYPTRSATAVEFPTHCPYCGTALVFSDSGKTAACPNINCPERVVQKMTNMLDKLNFKGFGEATMRLLGFQSLDDFMHIDDEYVLEVMGFGANAEKFIAQRRAFMETSMWDYFMVGAIGFTNMAMTTWKKILNKINLIDILNLPDNVLRAKLINIRSIGDSVADVVINERPLYRKDLEAVLSFPNCVMSYMTASAPTIRFTGCRDADLEAELTRMGYDANGKAGVTKSTNILIVPEIGHMSDKVKKAGPQTMIVALDEFKRNMDYYLNQIPQMG